jgi:hypothetical protein
MSLVKSSNVESTSGQDYSLVVLAKTMGVLSGLPTMTIIWAWGIGIGGMALGLPYLTSAVSITSMRYNY